MRVAIDDFGTGYSSLATSALPVDILKIDKSFVDGTSARRRSDRAGLGGHGPRPDARAATIAEGIETEPQRRALRALGCELAQGYLFARPLPADELEALLVGPPRGVGAARLRTGDDELIVGRGAGAAPEPPLAVASAVAPGPAEEPEEEPAARGVGAARLRLLRDPDSGADPPEE